MSFINSENRNSHVPSAIITNRAYNLRNIARMRRCSFCKEPGHAINNCDSVEITNFETECLYNKTLLDQNGSSVAAFRSWLLNKLLESPQLVKTFAIRKCECTLRTPTIRCLDKILNYFYGNAEMEENDLDFIPFNDENPYNETEQGLMALAGILMLAGYTNENVLQLIYSGLGERNNTFHFTTILESLKQKEQNQKKSLECSICFESYTKNKFVKLNCNHEFCGDCIINTFKTSNDTSPRCALCRSDIATITTYTSEMKNKIDELKN